MYFNSMALWIKEAILLTLNFWIRLRRWVSTVRGLTNIFSAISGEVMPFAKSWRISLSRRVTLGRLVDLDVLMMSFTSWLNAVCPSVASQMHLTNSSAEAFLSI